MGRLKASLLQGSSFSFGTVIIMWAILSAIYCFGQRIGLTRIVAAYSFPVEIKFYYAIEIKWRSATARWHGTTRRRLRRVDTNRTRSSEETTQGHQRPPPDERHGAVGDTLTGWAAHQQLNLSASLRQYSSPPFPESSTQWVRLTSRYLDDLQDDMDVLQDVAGCGIAVQHSRVRKFHGVYRLSFDRCRSLEIHGAHHPSQHHGALVHGLIVNDTSHLDNAGYPRSCLLCQWDIRWQKWRAWRYNASSFRSYSVR